MTIKLKKDGNIKVLSKESSLIKLLLADGWKQEVAKKVVKKESK